MPKKMGRPPTGEAAKDTQTTIRLAPGEVKMLEYCCKVLDLPKAEVLRQGLTIMYGIAVQKDE